MSTRKDQLLRRAAGQKGRAVALTREEKALRAILEQMQEAHSQMVPDMTEYAKKTDIPTVPDMTEYAKKTDIPTVPDMTEYAKKTDIPTVPDMTEYAKKTDVTDAIATAITGAMEASY